MGRVMANIGHPNDKHVKAILRAMAAANGGVVLTKALSRGCAPWNAFSNWLAMTGPPVDEGEWLERVPPIVAPLARGWRVDRYNAFD